MLSNGRFPADIMMIFALQLLWSSSLRGDLHGIAIPEVPGSIANQFK